MKRAMPPIVNDQSSILILGSMPGEKSLAQEQYYANRGNHFWKLMFAVFDETFSFEYEDRIKLLEQYNIALWDVLAFCEREGSLDSKIKNEVVNDFEVFTGLYPNIRHIIFSSKAAEKYYFQHFGHLPGIKYHIFPSPSGANAGKTYFQKLGEWQLLANLATK